MNELRDAKYFYDEIAGLAIQESDDWLESSRRQTKLISKLIRDRFDMKGPLSILDCSCGTGKAAIGFALDGHKVIGSDICSSEIDLAVSRARRLDLDIDFQVCDFRDLGVEIDRYFHLVYSFDNAIAHVLDLDDLAEVFKAMYSKLYSGGLMLIGVRDHDSIIEQTSASSFPVLLENSLGRKFYFQISDWTEDKKFYNLSLFEDSVGNLDPVAITTKMRVITRKDIFDLTSALGWEAAEWLDQDETGYYQPMLAVRKTG